MRWRLLYSPPRDGPGNMALDHALMERARQTGESVLRVYSWSTPVLSLGRNQRARGVYDDDELARHKITVVRRPTGGRALLHHREITYSATGPVTWDEGLRAVYNRVNALLLDSLTSLGIAASLAGKANRSLPQEDSPCFAEPTEGEIVVSGRKLAGSAQWRDGGALLQHGSIIVDDDQSSIRALMRLPADRPPSPATLRHLLGREPDVKEVAEALFSAVRRLEDPRASPLTDTDTDSLGSASLLDHYRDPAWTWRR